MSRPDLHKARDLLRRAVRLLDLANQHRQIASGLGEAATRLHETATAIMAGQPGSPACPAPAQGGRQLDTRH